MLGSEERWQAVVSFCGRVMSQKEDAERERQREEGVAPARRRRGRAR